MDIIKKKLGSIKKSAQELPKKKVPFSNSSLFSHLNKQNPAKRTPSKNRKPKNQYRDAFFQRFVSLLPSKKTFYILSIFIILILIIVGSLLWYFNNTTIVPATGGSLREGVVGQPQNINPLYTVTQDVTGIDRTLEHLIYPRLFSTDDQGELTADIIESFEKSEDNLTYTFVLRDNLYWDDGTPLTSEDIQFTIERIQDETYESPLITALRGVTIEQQDSRTFRLSLEEPYTPFQYNLTFGILPQHIWENYSPEDTRTAVENLKPVGAGMFQIGDIKQNEEGRITSLSLQRNPGYWGNQPHIDSVSFLFYPNEDALIKAFNRGEISAITSLKNLNPLFESQNEIQTHILNIPQYFSIFFNLQDDFIETYPEIRSALNQAISRDRLIEDALDGEATKVTGALTPFNTFYTESTDPFDIEQAQETMIEAGWIQNEEDSIFRRDDEKASITILATEGNTISSLTTMIQEMALEVGIEVIIELQSFSEISQNQVPNRDYQAIFIGVALNTYPDPYVYWHSSQSTTLGFNLSQYSNANADELLENARTSNDKDAIKENLEKFQEKIEEDVPAIFLYSPHIKFYTQSPLSNVSVTQGNTSADRYRSVEQWFANTRRDWKE